MQSKEYKGTLIIASHGHAGKDGKLNGYGIEAVQSVASRLVEWADKSKLTSDKVIIAHGAEPRHRETAEILQKIFVPNAELKSIPELAVQGDEFPIDIELVVDAVWPVIADFPLAILVASYPYTGSLTSEIHVHGISDLQNLEYGEVHITLSGGMHYTFLENGMVESFRPKL